MAPDSTSGTTPARERLRVPVRGNSMEPTLREGDICWVRVGRPKGLRVGQIVVIHTRRGWIVHRVVGAWGGWIVTRGDERVRVDARVSKRAVVGVVVRAERAGHPRSLHDAGLDRFCYIGWTWWRALGRSVWKRLRAGMEEPG